jgi:hypothetical protein
LFDIKPVSHDKSCRPPSSFKCGLNPYLHLSGPVSRNPRLKDRSGSDSLYDRVQGHSLGASGPEFSITNQIVKKKERKRSNLIILSFQLCGCVSNIINPPPRHFNFSPSVTSSQPHSSHPPSVVFLSTPLSRSHRPIVPHLRLAYCGCRPRVFSHPKYPIHTSSLGL